MIHPESESLSEYLDDTLSESERSEVERHLGDCSRCSGLLAELRRVAESARTLPGVSPDHDLWPGVERRLGDAPAPDSRWIRALVAVAAVLVVATGVTFLALRRAPVDEAPRVSRSPEVAIRGEGEAEVLARAITDLKAIDVTSVDEQVRALLDVQTAALDRAADELRAAIRANPEDVWLREQLDRTLRQELDLLSEWTRVIPEVKS